MGRLVHCWKLLYQCFTGERSVTYEEKNSQYFRIHLRPDFISSSLFLDHLPSENFDGDFGKEITNRLGKEIEIIFPETRRKWAFILIKPTSLNLGLELP